jgi:hypothetical protein
MINSASIYIINILNCRLIHENIAAKDLFAKSGSMIGKKMLS